MQEYFTSPLFLVIPPLPIVPVSATRCALETGATQRGHPISGTAPVSLPRVSRLALFHTTADDGLYYVVKTIAGVSDTDSVNVFIHPLPTLNISSNIPVPLRFLYALPRYFRILPAKHSVGPGPVDLPLFRSSPLLRLIPPNRVYEVTAISQFGCQNSNSYDVYITPSFTAKSRPGCVFDTALIVDNTVNANGYIWSFGDLSTNYVGRDPGMHIYSSGHKNYTIVLTASNPHCEAADSLTINLEHSVHALFKASPDTVCFEPGVSIYFPDSSYADLYNVAQPVVSSVWYFGDGTSNVTNDTPVTHIYTNPGEYPVRLIVRDGLNCPDSLDENVFVVQINIKSLHDTLLCLSEPMPIPNTITTIPAASTQLIFQYVWTQSTPNLNDTSIQIPKTFGIGTFVDTLTVTIPNIPPDGCPVRDTITIYSVLGMRLTDVTPSQTIMYGSSIQLNADSEVIYRWKPNDGSLNNSDINNPVATPQLTALPLAVAVASTQPS